MKRFLIISIFSFLLVSCSNDKINENIAAVEDETELAFSELTDDIDFYNSELGVIGDPETKGRFWNFLKKLFCCDATGAAIGAGLGSSAGPGGILLGGLIGGLVGSVTCSGFIFDDTQTLQVGEPAQTITCVNVGATIYNSIEAVDLYDSVGFYHNRIISDIYESSGTEFLSYTEEQIYDLVVHKVKEFFTKQSIKKTMPNLTKYLDYNSTILSYIEHSDEVGLLNYLKELYPSRTGEFMVIFRYLDSISSLAVSDIPSYHEGFKNILNASNVSVDSKNYISMVTSVAANSAVLWNVDQE